MGKRSAVHSARLREHLSAAGTPLVGALLASAPEGSVSVRLYEASAAGMRAMLSAMITDLGACMRRWSARAVWVSGAS
jgi:hypothetical protein